MRAMLTALVLAFLLFVPTGLADIAIPPPRGLQTTMRVVDGATTQGYAVLEIPRSVLRSLAREQGALDIAPPPGDPSDPLTQIAAGIVLSLGAMFLGERYMRRRRERAKAKLTAKVVTLAIGAWVALAVFTPRTQAQNSTSTLSRAAASGALSGTVTVRVIDSDRSEIVFYAGGGYSPRRPGAGAARK